MPACLILCVCYEVEKLVETWTQSSDPDAYDVVIKPCAAQLAKSRASNLLGVVRGGQSVKDSS